LGVIISKPSSFKSCDMPVFCHVFLAGASAELGPRFL